MWISLRLVSLTSIWPPILHFIKPRRNPAPPLLSLLSSPDITYVGYLQGHLFRSIRLSVKLFPSRLGITQKERATSPVAEFLYLPNEWYVVVTCEGCRRRLPLFEDLTKGKGQLNVVYRWQCPYCGLTATYEGETVERYHHEDARSVN